MKIQIDTSAKTIKLESCEKLSALFDFLTKFFPDGEWEDYELQTNTQIVNWRNPIIVQHPPYWVNPYRYYTGDVICATETNCAAGVTGDACSSTTHAPAEFLTLTNSAAVLNFELN